jgi:hypothetical protein
MKSVVEVAFSGSWFCSSLTSRLRKSLEVSDELDDVLDDDDVVVVAVVAELVAETVIRNSGFPALPATRCRSAALEICVLMKRVGARIQARIHARENGFRHGKICRVRALEER